MNTNISVDGLTRKLYVLMGDTGVTRANLFTNRAQISWQSLALSPEREFENREVINGMRKEFVRKAECVLPVKTSDNPHGRDFSIYGFVFNEEQLLELLHAAYRMGLDDGRPPVCPTIR